MALGSVDGLPACTGRSESVVGQLLDVLPGRLRALLAYGVAVLIVGGAGYVLITVLAPVSALVLAIAGALLLAALLTPLVEALVRWHLPRGVAALLGVVALIAVVGLIGAFFAVGLAREVDNLRTELGGGVEKVREWLVNGPLQLDQAQLERVTAQAGELVPRLLTGALTVLETIALALLAVVLLFFLLRDGPAIIRWLLRGLSGRNRECAERAVDSGWRTLKAFVRGTAVIAAVDAIGIGIGLVVLDVPLALPLTLITFIAAFVPLVGATVAGALAVLVALATQGPTTALLVLGVVLLVQNLEGNLLEPLIMGRAVRLHPAVILVVVSAGALLGGVGGALLATPVTATTYRIVGVLRDCPGPPAADAGETGDDHPQSTDEA
jgi:predicted PurR-regulated permease PerM